VPERDHKRRAEWWLWAALALPLVLVASSLATLARLDQLRELYLRSRAAALAARLETLLPSASKQDLEALSDEEPALVELQVFLRPGEGGPEEAFLEPIWQGRELFRTERLRAEGTEIFRLYIPFHAGTELRIARLDLDASAADALVWPARNNVIIAALSGLVLILLTLYALWISRRTARLERRQLELEHLARLGQMSAALAHEIRNPLATIKGFAQLAAEKADSKTATLLAPILEEIQRLERLVSDLLLYGRPPQPRWRWTEWDGLAAELEAHAREAAGGRPVRLLRTADNVRFRTDPDLLKAALLNLIRNAAEALDEQGGEIRLEAISPRGGGLILAVEDDGLGLAEEARAHLFEPFFTTKAFGTGLGLPIARKLAEALGGRLQLAAREPRGTRAELVFPAAELERVAREEKSAWK